MPGPGMKAAIDATLRRPPLRRLRLSRKASERSVSARTLRSTIATCSARSSASAAPTRPKPALLTTTSGSSPRSSSAAAIACAASRRARSAPRTVGRGARFAAMASASTPSTCSRLATRTSSWSWAANSCANAEPIRSAPDQVAFEVVDVSVGIGDLPHHFDDAAAAILVKKATDQAGEVIEIHGLVLGRSRLGDQFIRRRLVELKLLLDDRMQLVALGVGNVA